MAHKVGVYICRCGTNISDVVNVDQLVEKYGKDKRVSVSAPHDFLCAPAGREFLAQEIRTKGVDRIVIVACSPREHEITFRRVCEGAGLNPYLFQMVNIREHCAWVHNDKAAATEKADHMIEAAIRRVLLHQPLEKCELDCSTDTMIIGGGPAGIQAALSLAEAGRKVYLVDRLPSIGGWIPKYEKAAPTFECCPCMLAPKIAQVGENAKNIELLTYTDVEDIVGFYGNYTVKVNKKARYVDPVACIGCGACYEPCPVEVPKEFDERLGKRKAIYTIFPGALPNAPVIDRENCLRFKGQDCKKCMEGCPFGAVVYDQKDEKLEIKVGAIIIATGSKLFDVSRIPNLGYGKVNDVVTAHEFERLGSTTGCTGGKILKKNGNQPKSIGVLHCVGSLDDRYHSYCSQICCEYAMKFGILAKEGMHDCQVTNLYKEMVLAGKGYDLLAKRSLHEGTRTIRIDSPNDCQVSQSGEQVKIEYTVNGQKQSQVFDMLVLCPALEPADGTDKIAQMLQLKKSADGFLAEEQVNMETVATTVNGIFIAGCAAGPKGIASSTAQAQAAAGKIMAKLQPGKKLEVEVITASIDEDRCSGCKTCINMCPYKAITYNAEKKHAQLNEVLCRGCGTCVAACPSGCITGKHFTREEILAEIGGVI